MHPYAQKLRAGDVNWHEEFQRLIESDWREDVPLKLRKLRKLHDDFLTAAKNVVRNILGTLSPAQTIFLSLHRSW